MNGKRWRAPGALLPLVLLTCLSCLSCGEDSAGPPPAVQHLPFGVHAVPRGAPGADPLLVEAYSDIDRGGFAWAQVEIDWGVSEPAFGVYRWQTLDDHVRQSIRTGVPLSLVVRLVDESLLGPFPDDLRGQGLDSPNVRVRFPVFLRAAVERSRGQLAQLWIGRAVDRRLDADPGELEAFRVLFALAADSVRSVAPDLPIGTSFTYTGAPVSGALSILAPHLDRIGWVVLPLDAEYQPSPDPEGALELVREAVEVQSGRPVILTEVGYRRVGGDAEADRFLAGLHAYLEGAPTQLVGVTWFGLYDWYASRASERAAALHPEDPEAASAYSAWLRSSGLGQVSGAATVLWYRAFDWNRER